MEAEAVPVVPVVEAEMEVPVPMDVEMPVVVEVHTTPHSQRARWCHTLGPSNTSPHPSPADTQCMHLNPRRISTR